MYLPASFREDDRDGHQALIEAHPLGTLVALGPAGFDASPLSFHLVLDTAPLGALFAPT